MLVTGQVLMLLIVFAVVVCSNDFVCVRCNCYVCLLLSVVEVC